MTKLKLLSICYLLTITAVSTLPMLYDNSVPAQADSESGNSGKHTVRVYFSDRLSANKIFISFENAILETNYKENYHIIEIASDHLDLLTNADLTFDIITEHEPLASLDQEDTTVQGIAGYPCYETLEETYTAAESIATNYPNLASWRDVGDSWEKTAGLGGYDIMVLVLTNSTILGDKPKLFATAAIHAREYTTAPLCLFFAKYLVDNYGIDADATWILDHHEIHLMFCANPDGRTQAEAGLSWRKNTNQNYCGATSINRGADINRNFDYAWGYGTGSSISECDENYRGSYAASEPETQAVQNYMRSIFPDQRDSGSSAAAPDDTTGIHLDFHSYSEVIIWPWGYTNALAPNGIQLQTLGRKFAYWNNYLPRQGIGIYLTDGTVKEFCYGELGVPSFVFELGTAFFQSCNYYENNIIPDNIPAIIYAAKVARTPYLTPAGPNTYSLGLSTDLVPSGTDLTLTATIDDTQFSNRNGTEPTHNIIAAEYYIDTPPWITNPIPEAISMSPSDGIFNDEIEIVEAKINTADLSEGKHIIFVRGCDANNNWGAFSAIFLNIANPVSHQVATPIFLPTPEIYDGSQPIEILCSSSDSEIYYTTNGEDPTSDSTLYNQPLYFNHTTTLKARAYKNGWTPSEITIGDYVIGDIDFDGDGFTPLQGDCDDDNLGVHPGAKEIINDGIDQDCDGQDFTVEVDVGNIIAVDFIESDDPIYLELMPNDLVCDPIRIDLSINSVQGTAEFILNLPEAAPAGYVPYKRTQDTWIEFSRDLVSAGRGDGAEFIDPQRKQLKVYITDNSQYDNNSELNIISDPITIAAPGFVEDQGDSGGGGSGGGCFIYSLVGLSQKPKTIIGHIFSYHP